MPQVTDDESEVLALIETEQLSFAGKAVGVVVGCQAAAAEAAPAEDTKVEKKLSELIIDSGSQTTDGEQNSSPAELAQVSLELKEVITNSSQASTLVPTDGTTLTLRRTERAVATPISYHPRDLLRLIHEHLHALGLAESAATLLKEAELTPLPFLAAPSSLSRQASGQEASSVQLQWPSGRTPCGFLSNRPKVLSDQEDSCLGYDSSVLSSRKKQLASSASHGYSRVTSKLEESPIPSNSRSNNVSFSLLYTPSYTPKDHHRHFLPNVQSVDSDENQLTAVQMSQTSSSQHGLLNDPLLSGAERLTLDSLVVQCLELQHRQCSTPITTLPPLSLFHPHVCPKPRQSLDAPSNVTARLRSREIRSMYGGIHGSYKDRQFVYSRFRPWRTCRDDPAALFTCISFLGDFSRIAAGGHSGELKVFNSNSNTVLESCTSHQYPLTLLQSHFSGDAQLLLSSSSNDVCLWDASLVSAGPKHSFEGIKTARFSNSGAMFAALQSDSSQQEILLYDIHTCQLKMKFTDTSNNHAGCDGAFSHVHFSPSDSMLLWNGDLWDHRAPDPIHRFDLFSDYGGGGFHPAGNEVIINSEVWDLRKFKLHVSVPSLDRTFITFNADGDVIYAILRRDKDNLSSAFSLRRAKHPLFSDVRIVDAVHYVDIATVPVHRCVLDFACEPTESSVGVVTMDDSHDMSSSLSIYEIGRPQPTDEDYDDVDDENIKFEDAEKDSWESRDEEVVEDYTSDDFRF